MQPLAHRIPRLAATAMVLGLAISLALFALTDWSLSDAEAYWSAAHRIRLGQPLYAPVSDVEGSDVYRYAPWFAFAAVPFTFLPQWAAGLIWSGILLAASVVAIVPLVRGRAYLAAAFFGSVLVGISAIGNAQPLIVAALVWGLERRSGPLWVALGASLKAVPILYSLVYLGRRQWWRFGASVALTALLIAPFLLNDLSNYVTNPGYAGLLISWPGVYVAAVGVGVTATIWLARSRFGWLAAATTVALALPRFFVYDVTFLLPGTLPAIIPSPARSVAPEEPAPSGSAAAPEPPA